MAKKGVKGTLTMLSLHNDKINTSYLHCLISLSIWVNKNLYSRQHLEYIGASLEDVFGQSLEMLFRANQNLS